MEDKGGLSKLYLKKIAEKRWFYKVYVMFTEYNNKQQLYLLYLPPFSNFVLTVGKCIKLKQRGF